jgi:hypothetical protein
MSSPTGTSPNALTCPQCHKRVDPAVWAMHPRYCTAAGTAEHPSADSARETARPAPATSPSPAARKGSGEIATYLVVGVLLQFLGGVLLGVGFASMTSTDLLTGASETSGGAVVAVLAGWAAVGAGTFCILVAVIAKGVQIGNRAS